VNSEPKEFHGWSFVDYRDAPEQEIVAFFELRPEWPRTLTIEGGDDHEPRPAAFAEEFQIHMTENFPSTGGTLAFRGLAQRIEAYHMIDSLEAAVRFRLGDLDDEAITTLKTFAVLQGSRNASNFAAMVLHSLLGLKQAQDHLQTFCWDPIGRASDCKCPNPMHQPTAGGWERFLPSRRVSLPIPEQKGRRNRVERWRGSLGKQKAVSHLILLI
jgi:hypothetical protein